MHIEQKKGFRILFLAELCLLILGIAGLFGKDDVYHYDMKNATINMGEYSEELGGCYMDESYGGACIAMELDGIALPIGVYEVTLCYDTDTNMKNVCYMEDGSPSYRSFLCNGEHLYAELGKTDFQIWVYTNKDDLSLLVEYAGEGSMVVRELWITETNALNRMLLFWLVAGLTVVNICVLFAHYDKVYGVSGQTKRVTLGLCVVILLSSLPLLWDRMISSGDLSYHLMRLVGVKDGLADGQFPVRIAPEWQQGYGYASSIFYGETLLYIAAVFRLIGFPLVTSYRMFLFVINAMTVLIAYYCFGKMFRDKYIGVLCSGVYTVSIYRISKTFVCGSFGETFAILLLPLLAYGFYRVFSEDINTEGYQRAWIPLTIGFTGLVQSHLLTGELAGLFTIILCMVMWKKVFRPKTFIVLAKTVIYSILLSLWFLVPFADYMLRDDFVIQHVSGRTIQNRGLFLAHLFFTYYSEGTTVYYDSTGMFNSEPMGVGIALWLPMLLLAGIFFFRKDYTLSAKEQALGKIVLTFSILAMVMSLSIFPWDRIQSLSSITATLVSSIQFPNRFLTIANVCLTIVTGVLMRWVIGRWKEKGLVFYSVGTAVLVLISSVFLMISIMFECATIQVYDEECIGSGYVAGGEYLPYEVDATQFLYRAPRAEDNIIIESYEKEGLHVSVECYNNSEREGGMELPLLYYRGYRAFDAATGVELPVYKGTNSVVGVAVQPRYNGIIEVHFVSQWYWRVAEVISVLTFALLCAGCYIQKRSVSTDRKEDCYVEKI